jgi:hypothetical protein
MSEIMARLNEIADPTVRALASTMRSESWRKHAETTQGSQTDADVTYPVYDNGTWRQTRTLRSGSQTTASR